MKLDHDCIRDTLLFLESQDNVKLDMEGDPTWEWTSLEKVCEALPKYSKETIFYTIFNLSQSDLLNCSIHYSNDSASICLVNYITFAGHEYLEEIRPASRWKKISAIAAKAGAFTLPIIKAVAEDLIKTEAAKLLADNFPIVGQ